MNPSDASPSRPRSDAMAVTSLLLLTAAVLAAFFGLYQLVETYVLAARLPMRVLHLLHIIRGITASVLVAGFVAYYMVRHAKAGFGGAPSAGSIPDRRERQLEHVRWFVQMRWVSAGFTLALIVIAVPLTSILSVKHLPQLLAWWTVLVVANVFFARAIGSGVPADTQIVTQVGVDLVILTGLLNASGGVENPLSIAYLFHVIIAGILLPTRKAVGVAVAASAFFSLLAIGELLHFLPHSTILLFPHAPEAGHLPAHAAHDPVFVAGRVVSFVGVMLLTSYFTTLVTRKLHQREAELEQAARKAVLDHSRLEGVIDAAGLGMVVLGRDLVVEWFNPRLAAWMGWSDEMIGTTLAHTHDQTSACLACLVADTLRDGRKTESEAVLPMPGNSSRYFRHVVSPVRDRGGQPVQAVDVVEDITNRKALETEALHAGRLAVLGQLAAGVAHEIGNPLSSIHARLQLMKRRDDPAFARESLSTLQAQIDRIGRIVRGVSNLARKPSDAWASVDLSAVIEEAISLVKFDKRAANIRFTADLRRGGSRVHAIREQLLQVFINLLLNAVESMPDGGSVEIAAAERDGRVTVSVADTGTGFDEAVRARLFEPFFTTKRQGTGLGLSISHSLLHAHGGSIDAASEMGRGSCFTVTLPVGGAS